MSDPTKPSLQLRVLRLGFFQDGDVGVGVLPAREEILVGILAQFLFLRISREGVVQQPRLLTTVRISKARGRSCVRRPEYSGP
jgi:hypothetical protein